MKISCWLSIHAYECLLKETPCSLCRYDVRLLEFFFIREPPRHRRNSANSCACVGPHGIRQKRTKYGLVACPRRPTVEGEYHSRFKCVSFYLPRSLLGWTPDKTHSHILPITGLKCAERSMRFSRLSLRFICNN